MRKYHRIKILPKYFNDIVAAGGGRKRFELRKNDKDYKVGYMVTLCECIGKEYTGRKMTIEIMYLLKDCPEYGLMDGYCIFGW